MRRNKRTVVGRCSKLLLLGILLMMGITLLVPGSDWLTLVIAFLSPFYGFTLGYTRGWDDNEKPSTLKGP